MMLAEPDGPVKSKLTETLMVDNWERWEINIQETTVLGSIVKALEKSFRLQSRDVMFGSTTLFAYAFRD